jgi:effector-binding domain-containing protein
MLEKPHFTITAVQQLAVLPLTVPRAEIRQVMGPGLRELLTAVAAQGSAPAGPWFTHHLRLDPDVFDFEIGVAVTAPVAAAGRMRPGQWPAQQVARAVYRGPYEGLGAAWGEFVAWLAAQGHTPAADLWERYLTGPESSPEPAEWRTELTRPLLGPA